MSWFSRKKTKNTLPTPLTRERIIQVLDKAGCEFELENSNIYANIDGYFTVIEFSEQRNYSVISARYSTDILREEHFAEALRWSNEWNNGINYGTARICRKQNEIYMIASCLQLTEGGLTDEQLELFIWTGIKANTNALDQFAERLSLPIPKR
ncbi:YbjN domain-containing protein [Actinomycetaceae bacterium TAE3-ERU4]|nr:YbjN domain-containing protein [Actinomycetaceae bacterium TAE3-ERU4]